MWNKCKIKSFEPVISNTDFKLIIMPVVNENIIKTRNILLLILI